MNSEARQYIEKLNLVPHPEGGYYKEIYRSDEIILPEGLPARFRNKKSISTSIYYLLEGIQKSYFHSLKSDEIWHFYNGCGVIIHIIDNSGNLSKIDIGKGSEFQAIIKHGNWFAAELKDKNSFCLMGCTVAPGFDFEDFEPGIRENLLILFPSYKELIERFTKN